MSKKLIIDRFNKTVTFKDEEKELTVPYENIRIDHGSYCYKFAVDLDFYADEIETYN